MCLPAYPHPSSHYTIVLSETWESSGSCVNAWLRERIVWCVPRRRVVENPAWWFMCTNLKNNITKPRQHYAIEKPSNMKKQASRTEIASYIAVCESFSFSSRDKGKGFRDWSRGVCRRTNGKGQASSKTNEPIPMTECLSILPISSHPSISYADTDCW